MNPKVESFCSLPAEWVESLYLTQPKSCLESVCRFVKGQLIATTIFPALALIDFARYAVKAAVERSWALVSFDEDSKKIHYDEAMRCAELAVKHFLGFISFLGGLICPDIVTHHFLSDRSRPDYIEPYGKLYSAPGVEKQPESIADVLELVRQAKTEGKTVTVSGARMSQGEQILPTSEKSLSINMLKMNQVEIKPDMKTAVVGAGARWADVQRAADPHGLAVKVMQASNVFSVGGSIGANIHGWDHQAGTLAETVKKLWIVDAEGELRILGPEDELFGLVVGSYGQFGIIVQAEIALAENEELLEQGKSIKPEDYVEYFEQHVLTDPKARMHLYRLSLDPDHLLEEGIAVNYDLVGQPGGKVTPHLVEEGVRGTRMDRILLHLARRFKFMRSLYWKDESLRIQYNQDALTRNQIMRPPINAALHHSTAESEWLQEYFVAGKDLAPFLKKLGAILKENDVPLLNATVRYVKQDHRSEMGYARAGDRYAVVLFFTQSLQKEEVEQTKKWIQQVNDELAACGGSYYLPYQPFATQEQFEASYPNAAHVAAKKKEYDPDGRFETRLSKQYFQQVTPTQEASHVG